jgi:hypothetical protein
MSRKIFKIYKMKKQLLFIAIASLFSTLASAADLYVRDFGAGGAYSTITAAITAAVDGDRIIIRPKVGGVPYIENLTIDKSLSFVSETVGAKYLVQGSVTITPLPGRIITINNLSLTLGFASTESVGGRTTVNLLNSSITSVTTLNYLNTTFNASGCIFGSNVGFSHGKITGCRLNGSFNCSDVIDTSLATDDIEIIGNYANAIVCNQPNYKFKFFNNFLYSSNGGISITGAKTGSVNEIYNNTIPYCNTTNGFYSSIYIGLTFGSPSTTFSILNNILSSNTGSNSGIMEIFNTSSSSFASVYAFYNMSATPMTFTGVTSESSNVGSAVFTVNNTTTYAVTGANVNAGYPDDEFRDLDLSLNDIGNYGGSNSWANYWPVTPGNKPQISNLNTPRRIYTGTTTLNATGSGYSK